MDDIRKPVFDAIRTLRGKGFSQMEVTQVDDLLDRLGIGRTATPPAPGDAAAPWIVEARKHIGVTEVPGPRHNPLVLAIWKALGQPFTDDETPWCGGFTGYVLNQVGIKGSNSPAWAKSWATWGKPCDRALGAVAVFGRAGGGGHVGFLVGVSADGKRLYILGGNQSNQVNISPIDASRLIALRWPSALPVGGKAPVMSGGVVSTNES